MSYIFKILASLLLYAGFLCNNEAKAQELKCNVSVMGTQVQTSNRQIFKTLETALYEYMNTRSWTNNVFLVDERIECSILLNISEWDNIDRFTAEIQVQARRPVFNSSYNSTTLNFRDVEVDFNYIEFEPLEFNPSVYTSNLTSIMAYYAYIILGIDYDTYSPQGGTPFFKIAESIVLNAQSSSEAGWKSMSKDRKNRYWLVNNFLDPKYTPLRQFMYMFHRQGLDLMSANPANGRKEIALSVEELQKIYRAKPDAYMFLFQVVLDAKSTEIADIFTESFPEEKQRVHAILVEIDPSNKNKYAKIIDEAAAQ